MFNFCPSPSSLSPRASVCVECSLRDDCLRRYAFCKHSKSPIFNRNMRTLNRLPIYMGEDLCDNINRLCVLKDIIEFDKKELKSCEYVNTNHYKGGRYCPERIHHTYHWISKTTYPTGYNWIQVDNSLDAMSDYGERGSRCIQSYYDDTKKAKKKFRGWFKSITHKRIMSRFNLNMNKMYGEDTIEMRRNFPLWNQVNYWMKQSVNGYNPLRNNWNDEDVYHNFFKEIKRRVRYVCNGIKVQTVRKYNHEYMYEVDRTRIYQFRRYMELFKNTNDKMEKYWYLLKIGMLCYNDRTLTDWEASKEFFYLGTYKTHIRYLNDGRFPLHHLIGYNDEEDWDDDHIWMSDRKQFYDLRHLIYKMTNNQNLFRAYDIYGTTDTNNFKELITTDIELPKINTLRWQRKKCMIELIKTTRRIRSDCGRSRGPNIRTFKKNKKTCILELKDKTRRIRNDCGRSRGPNIRTTNPYYCIFTLYPQI